MTKLEKNNKALIYSFVGLFFTFIGMMLISFKKYDNIALIVAIFGVIIALFGLMKIVNNKNKANNE